MLGKTPRKPGTGLLAPGSCDSQPHIEIFLTFSAARCLSLYERKRGPWGVAGPRPVSHKLRRLFGRTPGRGRWVKFFRS